MLNNFAVNDDLQMKDPLTRKSAQVLMSEITIWLMDDNNIFFVYQFLVIYLFIYSFFWR